MKKEYNILNYYLMRALFLGIGISRILTLTNEYTPYALILGTIIGTLLIMLYKKVELSNKFSIVVSSIFLFLLALLILIYMISTMYLTEMPQFLIGLPIILTIIYVLSKKEIVVFRLSNILLFFNIVLYLISTTSLIKYIDLTSFSFNNTPLINIVYGALLYALYSVTPTVLTRYKEYQNYSLVKTYIISSITMSITFLLTFSILGKNLIALYRYPEYIILKKVSIGHAFENIENIICFMWIFDIYILLLYMANNLKRCFNSVKIPSIIIFILLLIIIFISKYYTLVIAFYKFGFIGLAIILGLILLLNKKRRKIEKEDN